MSNLSFSLTRTKRPNLKVIFCSLFLIVLVQKLMSADIYVDNIKGNDSHDGSQATPYRSIRAAAKALKPGDTLHMVPNEEPYTLEETVEPGSVGLIEIVKSQAGTAEKPTVVDGHGSKVLGLFHYKAEKWQDEGSSVFSMRLPNNTVTMYNLGYWTDVIPIVFFDGKPAKPVKSREELVAGSFFLVKKLTKEAPANNTLFVKLPEGKTPAEIKITAPSNITIQSNTSHVTFRNIETSYSSFDGLGSFWGEGLLFENLRASYCMNQGISHHSTVGVLIRNCRFDHNVDCGILDISMGDAKTGDEKKPTFARYENCLVDNNVWLGGVRFQNRVRYEMDSCIIRDNHAKTAVISVASNTSLSLTNCLIILGDANAKTGIMAEANSTLELKNCTIIGFANGLIAASGAKVSVSNSVFIDCETSITVPTDLGAGGIDSNQNVFVGKTSFKVDQKAIGSLEEFTKASGLEKDSIVLPQGSGPENLKAKDGSLCGANVNPETVGLKQ